MLLQIASWNTVAAVPEPIEGADASKCRPISELQQWSHINRKKNNAVFFFIILRMNDI